MFERLNKFVKLKKEQLVKLAEAHALPYGMGRSPPGVAQQVLEGMVSVNLLQFTTIQLSLSMRTVSTLCGSLKGETDKGFKDLKPRERTPYVAL